MRSCVIAVMFCCAYFAEALGSAEISPLLPGESVTAFLQASAQPQTQDQVSSHLQRANEYLKEKRPELAIPEFAAVVATDPNNLDAEANLGVLLFFSGRPQEAELHLRAALAIDPSQRKLQVLLGTCEHREGRLAEARKDLMAAMPDIQDPKVRKQAGLEIVEVDTALNDLVAAAVIADQLKAEFSTDPEVLFADHRVHSDLADEALLDLSIAAPESAQLHQAMAHELIRERDNKGAIENLREALKLNPNLPGGHYELAELLRLSTLPDDKTEAAKQYELAVEQQPSDAASLTRLGDIAAANEDHAAAVTRYKQALAAQQEYPNAEIGLANELSEMGHPDEALPLLQQAIQSDPLSMLAHYRLSAVYRSLHRPEDAKREIAEYKKLKSMKDSLRSVYDTLRLDSPQGSDVKK